MTAEKNIIVVDDEVSVVDTLKIILADLGDIQGFLSIPSFDKFIEKNPRIDLLIIDYRIDKEDGIEYYKNVFRKKYPDVPAVLISAIKGHHQNTSMQQESKYFSKIFEKPFDAFALKLCIEELQGKA